MNINLLKIKTYINNNFKNFDWKFYLNSHDDLKILFKNEMDCVNHFYNFGRFEKRPYNLKSFYDKYPDFDWNIYLEMNDDLKKLKTQQQAIWHFCSFGKDENRIYSKTTLESNKLTDTNKDINNSKTTLESNKLTDIDFDDICNNDFSCYIKKCNIRQLVTSPSLAHFNDRFIRVYNLSSYSEVNNPTIFFGIYSLDDMNKILQHQGDYYLMFGGSDIDIMRKSFWNNNSFKKVLSNAKIVFSISKNIQDRLNELNVKNILINFNLVDTTLFKKTEKIGNKVYIYNGYSKGNEHLYGKTIYEEVMKKLPEYEYILSNDLNLPYDKMPEIYSQCFIGLRLTDKDGNANTVQEFEAMGMPIVHNQSEYGLKWKSVDDVVRIITQYKNNTKNIYDKERLNCLFNSKELDFYNDDIKEEHLKDIYENIDNFINLISNYKKILLICGDYPGYGGAATNCNKIQEFLNERNYDTYALYYNYTNEKNISSENNKNYKCVMENKLKYELDNINFCPDLIILKSPVNIDLKKIFKCPVYYLIGGIYLNELNKYYYTLATKEENDKYINKNVLNQIQKVDLSFCNSSHTQNILKEYYNFSTYLFYSSFVSFYKKSISKDVNFNDRKYDYGLIVSNFDRKIKNIEESIEFLKDKSNVILIGNNSDKYKNYGFECVNLVDNKNIINYYKQIKYIVQDGYYESCSNVKVEAFYSGCKNVPVIVISSTQYPGYGGAATNAYKLIKYFRNKKFKVAGLFFNTTLNVNYDPDKIGGIFLYIFDNKKKLLETNIKIKNDIIKYLYKEPSICLAKNYLAPIFCKDIFDNYVVYLVSGINHIPTYYPNNTALEVLEPTFNLNTEYKINTENKINKEYKEYKHATEENCIKIVDNIIFNSELTKKLFKKIYPNSIKKINEEIIDTSINIENISNIDSKKYDIIICASSLTRIDKNNNFLINVLIDPIFDKYSKCIIGNNNNEFKKIKKSTIFDLLEHSECLKFLSSSKILLFPSRFDANPNTVKEAYYSKCLPLITKNIGFSEIYPEYLVCNTFDVFEWKAKLKYLLETYEEKKNTILKFNYDNVDKIIHLNISSGLTERNISSGLTEQNISSGLTEQNIFIKNREDFYTYFPHFDYIKFINKNINLNLNTENEVIEYIKNRLSDDKLIEYLYINNPENDYEINNIEKYKYYNIKLGISINEYIADLNYFHHENIKNIEEYNDKYNYIIVDSTNLNTNININFKYNIILIINNGFSNSINEIIKKNNIKFFLYDNENTKKQLLNFIDDYKLILNKNCFEKSFFEIYNYKKKYSLVNNAVYFDKIYDIEIIILYRINQNVNNFKINKSYCELRGVMNMLNEYIINIKSNKIICEYKNIEFTNITIKYRIMNEQITQLYLTKNLSLYKDDMRIHNTLNLKDYNNVNEPSFFYGIPREEDIDIIINHKSKKYIIFSGGDIDILYHKNKNTPYTQTRLNYLKKLHMLDEVYYIPRSIFMINDMKKLFYKYTYVPIFGNFIDDNYVPCKKGNKIYYYTYPDYQKYLYGDLLVKYIEKLRPDYEFLKLTVSNLYEKNIEYCIANKIQTVNNNNKNELIKKYNECCVSLRLTNHDGIANSVLEMSLLGICTIYNDKNLPCSLTYNNVDDIINHIDNQIKNKDIINYDIINKTKNFIKINNDIFRSNFYENKKKIIVACGDYPYFGGAATNSYALIKFFRFMGHNTVGLIVNNNYLSDIQIDPDNIKKMIHIVDFAVENKKEEIIKILEGIPDIIYVKKYILGYNLKKIFPNSTIIYILSSVVSSEQTWEIEINNTSNYVVPEIFKEFLSDDIIIVNSELSKNILKKFNDKLNINIAHTSFIINQNQNFNFLNLNKIECDVTNWQNRKYDFGFVASDCSRKVKNIELFLKIVNDNRYLFNTKVIVGKNSSNYKVNTNCKYYDLLKHDELIDLLLNTKLIIIPSHYESLSNLMFEAINYGCNILISDNIGGREFINDNCVANTLIEFKNQADMLISTQHNCIQNINTTVNDIYNSLYAPYYV